MLNELLGTETDTIDRLYLELSQFTKARTKRDLQLEQLLYAVERKFPCETRFETALRYIREAEAMANDGMQSAQVPNAALTGAEGVRVEGTVMQQEE
jgi:hypothetical protein